MITETTAISCAAFGALSTGLGISAGIGWIRCARMLAATRELAAHRKAEWLATVDDRDDAYRMADHYITELLLAEADRDKCKLRAEQYASSWGRVMRLLRLAEAANKEMRTNQLQREVADRAEPARIAA